MPSGPRRLVQKGIFHRKDAKAAEERKEFFENGGKKPENPVRRAVMFTLTHESSSLRPFAAFAALR
jgi:hypothetical protein